jgi:hemoglobin
MRTIICCLAAWAPLLAGGCRSEAAGGPQSVPATTTSTTDRKLDDIVFGAVKAAMEDAARLYNSGNATQSYYRFSAALKSVEPLLDHRPQLRTTVQRGISSAERLAESEMDRRAWALHYVVGQVYLGTQPPKIGEGKTLWQRLGGEDNVTKIMDDFLKLAREDPGVNLSRNNRFPMDEQRLTRFRTQLVHLASAVTGGPYKYEGKSMKAIHKDMGITDAEFDELLKHLRLALMSNGVKNVDVLTIMEMIPTIRGDIVAPPNVAPHQEPQRVLTLWDRLGGEKKVTKLVDDFVDLAVNDPRVRFSRDPKRKLSPQQVDHLKSQFVKLASQVSGGPYKYEGRSMKEVHLGMKITDEEFDALVSDLRVALTNNHVPLTEFTLMIKAIELTRKDIVEGAGMGAPALVQPRGPANPAAPRAAPKAGVRPTVQEADGTEFARPIEPRRDSSSWASHAQAASPLGSLIQWAIWQASGETSANKPRAGGDHAP